MQVRLTTPLTRQELAPLHAGDTVLLTGTVYTARDAAHARMNEALDRGEPRGLYSFIPLALADHTGKAQVQQARGKRTLGARLSAAWKWWICPLPFCWMPMAATCTSPARRHTCKA